MAERRHSDLRLYLRILGLARRYWPHIGLLFLLNFLTAPITLLNPLPVKLVVDSVLGSEPVPGFISGVLPEAATESASAILILAIVILVVPRLLSRMIGLGTNMLQTLTSCKMMIDFRGMLFRKLQDHSIAYHDRRGTADLAFRMQADTGCLQSIALEGFTPFITAVITIVTMLYISCRIDWQLAMITVCAGPVLLLLSRTYGRLLRGQAKQVRELRSSQFSVLHEVLSTIRVVKAFAQEEREHGRFMNLSNTTMKAQLRLTLMSGTYGLLLSLVTAATMGLTLYVGVRHVQREIISLGDLLLLWGYLSQLYNPVRSLATKMTALQQQFVSAERALDIIDDPDETTLKSGAIRVKRAKGLVTFQNVSFGYDEDDLILNRVSFSIPAGTSVGIKGQTGAGKSTLLSLLARFFDPTSGDIYIDDVKLPDYKLSDLRNQFAFMLQDPVLFPVSIAENIAYARPDASIEDIAAAARSANADQFINELPKGYDTLVGERGMRLSGGERQRVSLARAFLKDAPILLLDEPTSSVDHDTERSILDTVKELMQGRTTFMISHRLSALEDCDMIFELKDGQLIECQREAFDESEPDTPERLKAQNLPSSQTADD